MSGGGKHAPQKKRSARRRLVGYPKKVGHEEVVKMAKLPRGRSKDSGRGAEWEGATSGSSMLTSMKWERIKKGRNREEGEECPRNQRREGGET